MTRCLLIVYCKTHLDFRDVKMKKKSVIQDQWDMEMKITRLLFIKGSVLQGLC